MVYSLGSARAWLVWVLANCFVVFLFVIQTSYSVINPYIKDSLHLSLTQISIVAAVYTWCFAIFQIFGGSLLDHWGSRRVIFPGIILVSLATLMMACSYNFFILVLSQVVFALGACVGFIGAGYVGGKWFGLDKYGQMFGLVQVICATASAFLAVLITAVLHWITWRELYWICFLLGVILCILAGFWLKDPEPIEKSQKHFLKQIFSNLYQCLRVGHVWNAMVWGGIIFGLQFAFGVVWAPKILIAKGVSQTLASGSIFGIWLGLALGCYAFPLLSEKCFRRKWPSISGNILQFLVLLLILLTKINAVEGLILFTIFGIGNSTHMIAFATAQDIVGPKYIGSSAALVNSSTFIVSGLLITLPSLLLKNTTLNPHNLFMVFSPFLVLLIISIFMSLVMKETHPNSPAGQKMEKLS